MTGTVTQGTVLCVSASPMNITPVSARATVHFSEMYIDLHGASAGQ